MKTRLIRFALLLSVLGGVGQVEAAATNEGAAQAYCLSNGATLCPTIGGVSTLTYPVTIATGVNRQMAVFAFVGCNSGDTAPTATVSYGGTTLTPILSNTTNASRKGYLFAWPPGSEPPTGTANVVVTLGALLSTCVSGSGAGKSIQSGTILASGVDQTTTFRSQGSSTGSGTSVTLSIATSLADDLGIHAFCGGTTVGTTTETARWSSTFTNNSCGSSGGATAAGGDVNFSWTMTGVDSWILIGAAFRGAPATSPAAPGGVSWSPNSEPDLRGYNLRRCTGAACVPSVLFASVLAPTVDVPDLTRSLNTIYGYSVNAFDTGGNQSLYSATVYFDTGASPPPAPPTISSSTVDATGANVAWTGPPTTIRIVTTAGSDLTVVEPLSSFPAGRYTLTWPAGSTSVSFYARDAAGFDNTAALAFTTNSLVGIAPALDTLPPVLSNGRPATSLPFGTTASVMSVDTNEPAVCRYDPTDTTFDLMTASMTVLSRTASTTLTGLTDGSTATYYVRCQDSAGNANPASVSITVAVAAGPGADVTPPSTVASLVATVLSPSQVSLTWAAATDNVAVAGYYVSGCTGTGCTDYSLVAAPVPATSVILGLSAATSHTFAVRAIDTSGNLSVADSNLSVVSTQSNLDVTPPSTLVHLRLKASYTKSALLEWDPGTDTQSPVVFTIIEECLGVGCNDFATLKANITGELLLQALSSATTYRFRGKHSDVMGNVSVDYSNIVDVTTPASGLEQPRAGAYRRPWWEYPNKLARAAAAPRAPRN